MTVHLAIGLNRRRYTDVIASCPPILIVLAFKIFLARPLEKQFTYYEPTPQEAEEEFQRSLSEKRTNHHEMEKRFLHPALQSNMLFAVSPDCIRFTSYCGLSLRKRRSWCTNLKKHWHVKYCLNTPGSTRADTTLMLLISRQSDR